MTTLTPKNHAEYIRVVKDSLPKEAFSPQPYKLLFLGIYISILCLCYYLLSLIHYGFYFIVVIVIAHSLSCIGFLAHELSHNIIIKSKKGRYYLEVISWGINLIPATIWDRVHNHAHHAQANTPRDPDRQYFLTERNKATMYYTKAFYPNNKSIKWNPIVAFHFIPYIFRNIISAFYKRDSKPAVVPYKPKYSPKQRIKIFFELCIIINIQIGIYYMVGQNVIAYLTAGPLSYLLTSGILMSYIFTNHFLNPVTETTDPLLGTTTVQVPRILNKLHFNFAYHTEHHLFPSMNSEYYPKLSKLLKEKFPDRYHFIPIKHAWKKLWNNDVFISISKNTERNDSLHPVENNKQSS